MAGTIIFVGRLLTEDEWTTAKNSLPGVSKDAVNVLNKIQSKDGVLYLPASSRKQTVSSELNGAFKKSSRIGKDRRGNDCEVSPHFVQVTTKFRDAVNAIDCADIESDKQLRLSELQSFLAKLTDEVYLCYWDGINSNAQTNHVLQFFTSELPVVSNQFRNCAYHLLDKSKKDSVDSAENIAVLATTTCGDAVCEALKKIGLDYDFVSYPARDFNLELIKKCRAAIAIVSTDISDEKYRNELQIIAAFGIPLLLIRQRRIREVKVPACIRKDCVVDDEPTSGSAINSIRSSLIELVNETRHLACLKDIRMAIEGSGISPNGFHIESAYERLTAAFESVKEIQNDEIDFDLQAGHGFLKRASPLFHRKGNHVFAFSLDRVSTFWLKQSKEASEYARNFNGLNTIRVFVFSSPLALLEHFDVLNEHLDAYGQSYANGQSCNGAVLVTSLDHYKSFLTSIVQKFTDANQPLFWSQECTDWAIVRHLDGSIYVPTLDLEKYRVRKVGNDDKVWRAIAAEVENVLSNLATRPASYSNFGLSSDQPLRCAKWSDSHKYPEPRQQLLRAAFSRQNNEVIHLLFLSADVHEKYRGLDVRNAIVEAIQELRASPEEWRQYGTEMPWIGQLIQKYDNPEIDKLIPDPPVSYSFVLMMKFLNQSALEKYYVGANHVRRRDEFYDKIIEQIQSGLTKKLNELFKGDINDLQLVKEKLVRPVVTRMDYSYCIKPGDIF